MANLFNGYRHVKTNEPCTADDEEHAFANNSAINNTARSWSHYLIHSILIILLVTIATLNITPHIRLHRQMALSLEAPRSTFEADVQIPYRYKTEYSAENETLANELWEAIDSTSAGAIALDHEWAASKGLIRAQNFPWDTSKGLYYVQGIHDIHCVKLLRKSIVEYHHGLKQSVNYNHLHHCLNALRLRFMCIADDTPLATQLERSHATGQGQMQRCRNWDKLVLWANDPVRHACYGQVDEYADAKHNLERFRFCPEGSPFRGSMEAYFEKHGHQDLF